MADLKRITVEYLRALARKHLGSDHDLPRDGKALLAALVRRIPGLARLAGLWASPEVSAASSWDPKEGNPDRGGGGGRAHQEPPERPSPSPAPRPLPGDDEEKTPVYLPPRPAEVVTFPPKPKPSRPSRDDEATIPGVPPVRHTAPAAPAQEAHPAEPLVEGFFVARIAGEGELQRHHLTEATERQPGESLVPSDPNEPDLPLPREYGDDTLLLMARDPHTLFALWDFSPALRQRALTGLGRARAVMRVYEDSDRLVRVMDVSLESRSQYIHGLVAGRPYRVELHFVDEQERSRRIGLSSNCAVLPVSGPSSDTSVRLLRMPRVPSSREGLKEVAATAHTRTEPIEERAYISWRRVRLPGSPEGALHAEGPGEKGVPEAPGEVAPAREYLHARRAEASSARDLGWVPPGARVEADISTGGPAGASVSWRASHGPAGSSEQWAGLPERAEGRPWWLAPVGSQASPEVSAPWRESHGPAGSSEQWAGPPERAEGRPWWLASDGAPGVAAPWRESHGPAGSSESWAGIHGPVEGSGAWMGSRGPAGASEQWAGARAGARPVERWVWTYGPADAAGPWMESRGPAGSSERGAGGWGPAGSSAQWSGSHGPAGSSGQGR